jgi:hypothetical protein
MVLRPFLCERFATNAADKEFRHED